MFQLPAGRDKIVPGSGERKEAHGSSYKKATRATFAQSWLYFRRRRDNAAALYCAVMCV